MKGLRKDKGVTKVGEGLSNDRGVVTAAILDHIKTNGGGYAGWYVGIAQNPRDSLFKEHKVREDGKWVIREVSSRDIAQRIEEDFKKLGAKVNSGRGSDDSKFVYAYKIESYTKQ